VKVKTYTPVALVIALLLILPCINRADVTMNFMIYALILATAAQGWNLLSGMAGQMSFGHAAFFGTGAYTISLWQIHLGLDPWTGLIAAMGMGSVVGTIIGYLTFRAGLRGSYFALVTLAFAEVLRVLANAAAFTGGAAGSLLPLRTGLAHFQFADRTHFYWITVLVLGAGLILTRGISASRLGAQWVAVRENEHAARALGIDVLVVKLKAIALSSAMAAVAGALYAQYFLYIDAALVYGPKISVEVLLASIVGGLGTIFGPLVGVLGLHLLGEAVKTVTGEVPGVDLAIYGAVLIAAVCFLPQGVIGLTTRMHAACVRKKGTP